MLERRNGTLIVLCDTCAHQPPRDKLIVRSTVLGTLHFCNPNCAAEYYILVRATSHGY